MQRIYMDHAATTPTDPRVVEAMMPYFTEFFGNPSSIHGFGRAARKALEDARAVIAQELGAEPAGVIITSGGSEADNLAIKGVAAALREKGRHIITSSVEHHAVLDSCKYLEKQGFDVTYLPVDANGRVQVEDVQNALRDETILVTIMHANNEVGTIQPIKEISEVVKARSKALFHTDAVQTVGAIPVHLDELGVDLLSLSAHKFYGPKGVGALIIRKGVRFESLIHGGAQERNRRAGTENLPGVVGMAKALELANAELPEARPRITRLRDHLIQSVLNGFDHVRLNGHPTERLPGNANFSFEYIEGESLLLNLDLQGIAASSGSACTSGSLDPSHVLLAMGLCHATAHGSLRLSLGKGTTEEEVETVLKVLPGIVEKLRAMSPLYDHVRKECLTCTRTK
ncbi:MAG TPA: cysteine desulfurase NifS [Bacillota bacterium]|nr:cysteine desulfurase NifS [Bacillota bacterium]HPT67330.1 cysteine desulfurase NifS [Bacillota bacterium]